MSHRLDKITKIVLPLSGWSIFYVLVVLFLKDWLPTQNIHSPTKLHIHVFSLLYVLHFIVVVYVNSKILFPKLYLQGRIQGYAFFLMSLLMVLSLSKMILDSYFISLYLNSNERPTWLLTYGHFFSFLPTAILILGISTWSQLLKITHESKLRILEKEKEVNLYNSNSISDDKTEQSVHIKVDGKLVKIDANTILYIEGLKQYVRIHTNDNSYITLMSIKNLQEMLGDDQYIRVHKSYLVSKKAINTIDSSKIEIGTITIPIGRTFKDNVVNWKNDMINNT